MQRYQIRAKGQLENDWEEYFHPFSLTNLADGTLVIEGTPVDQSALFGVLSKLFQLNLPLVSITPVPDPSQSTEAL